MVFVYDVYSDFILNGFGYGVIVDYFIEDIECCVNWSFGKVNIGGVWQ